jgi:hypothetical protein
VSIKTTRTSIKKLCPQIVGQITSMKSFNKYFNCELNTEFKSKEHKSYIIDNIHTVMPIYLDHLFCCDYLFYIDLFHNKSHFFELCSFVTLDKDLFTFTKTCENWTESNTVKYAGKTIGEFQSHNNRNCFKFRFAFNGLLFLKQLKK